MKGKDKCKALKEIRAKIAEENDIEYVVSECKHKGDCKGTCPKCEAELIYLEKELEKRRNLGKKVCVTGLAVGMAATVAGCTPASIADPIVEFFGGTVGTEDLAGAAEPYSPDVVMGEVAEPPVELDGDVEYIPDDSENPSDEKCSGEDCSEDGSDENTSEGGSEDIELAGEAEPEPVEAAEDKN
jgi:hypothetical protein